MKKYALLCGILLSALCMQAQNAVVYVAADGAGDGSSWESPLGDIQKAINLAGADRENVKDVWIKAGTYNLTKRINLKDSVNVYGGFEGTEKDITERTKEPGAYAWEFDNLTIIDGGNSVACMAATKAMTKSIVVDGVVLQNGAALKANSDNGGGIRLNTNVTLRNSVVQFCYTNQAGGGVQIFPGGEVYDCLIAYNRQETGGNGGGGICSNNSTTGTSITIERCVFVGNTSSVRGGGINTQGAMGTTINACTFVNNTAIDGTSLKGGAAIYDNGQNKSHITNCAIYNNTGLTTVYLKANEFINNTVVKNIGGIYVAAADKAGEISNNVVWACVTDAAGATATSISGVAVSGLKALYNYTYNPVPTDKSWVLTDMTDVENTNKQFYSNQSNGDSEVPEGEDPGDKLTSGPHFRKVTSFIGAIPSGLSEADSLVLVNELDSVNLQLNAKSPLVNAGKDVAMAADCAGNARKQGTRTDVGAYELSYFNVNIADYNLELGAVYNEEGDTVRPNAELVAAYGDELALLFYTTSGEPVAQVTATTSLDGGLTFGGETVDVTDQIDEEGNLRIKVYEPLLISVVWEKETAIRNTTAATLHYRNTQDGICLTGIESGKAVEVFDLNGQLVVRRMASATTMNLSLQAGLYVVRQGDAHCKAVVR